MRFHRQPEYGNAFLCDPQHFSIKNRRNRGRKHVSHELIEALAIVKRQLRKRVDPERRGRGLSTMQNRADGFVLAAF